METSDTHLIYLAPGDVLKGRVEPIIWMRMSRAFANLGLAVELVTLYTYRRENIRRRQLLQHYGMEKADFRVTILPTPLTVNAPLFWYRVWTGALNYLHGLRLRLRLKQGRTNLIFYSRGPVALYPYLKLRGLFERVFNVTYIFETHVFPEGHGAQSVIRQTDGIVVSSRKLARDMETKLGIPPERLQVAYLASNAEHLSCGKEEAKKRLGLSSDKKYLVYTGKLLLPEVRLILDAAKIMESSDPGVEFVFVGGNPRILVQCEREVNKRGLSNVRFTGFVAPSEVGLYQEAADALMLYLVSNREIIQYITPSKVFDYLQAGRPIVVSEFPILHEILEHEKNALFVKPQDPPQLVAAFHRLLSDEALALRLSRGALHSSKNYSWKARVELIWNFINRVRSGALEPFPPAGQEGFIREIH